MFRLDGPNVIIPRHAGINEMTASGTYRRCATKLGKDWWKG